jgi:toxin ParE1/3/4
MRAVYWSNDALDELDRAIAYIAKESPRAAMLVVDRIAASVDLPAQYPSGRPGRVTGTYEKPVQRTPYILSYAISETRLTILRVIHGSRDWPQDAWPAA